MSIVPLDCRTRPELHGSGTDMKVEQDMKMEQDMKVEQDMKANEIPI
jgi:hypothetical protein